MEVDGNLEVLGIAVAAGASLMADMTEPPHNVA
jgi:hypothetical protein